MNERSPAADPTRAPASLPEDEFLLDLPDRGPVVGRVWSTGGSRGTIGVLHGLGDHAGRYGRIVEALTRRGFSVEALDLPGHGRSYGPRGHVESWEDYATAMDAWWSRPRSHGEAMVALLGHSMGSLVALDFVLRHPGRLRALVLSAPPFEVVLRAAMLKVRLAQIIVRFWPGFTQHTPILPSMLSRDPEVARAHNEDPLVHYMMSARLFFEYTGKNNDLKRRASEVPLPTLVIHGTGDLISSHVGSERWVEAAPSGRAELRLYPGLFHELLSEPEGPAIAGEVADWLTRTLA
jgi:lysophospholipase